MKKELYRTKLKGDFLEGIRSNKKSKYVPVQDICLSIFVNKR
ncbi:hypothetical protein Dip510_000783 [Elusimicrobium posterum]